MTYEVTAERQGRYWFFSVDGIRGGVGQSVRAADVERDAQDVIWLHTGQDDADVHVEFALTASADRSQPTLE